MGELRVGATVEGRDGGLGTVSALVVDPVAHAATHLVVEASPIEPRVLLPVAEVVDATPEVVQVDLDAGGLAALDRFDEPAYLGGDEELLLDEVLLAPTSYYLEPYASPVDAAVLADHERIPPGDVAVRRGMEVRSSDGTEVGRVDELLVDPTDGQITHLVLRQGHLLRHDDDVVIPVVAATRFEAGQVVLDLDLPAVEALEKIPVHRKGHVHRPDR